MGGAQLQKGDVMYLWEPIEIEHQKLMTAVGLYVHAARPLSAKYDQTHSPEEVD